ncbi:type VI secretion system baseplate subunit TssG [Paracoccus lutimaris]|nr:type VI secretion system baseplate subunit TssG [Paracoccus lutimaris]
MTQAPPPDIANTDFFDLLRQFETATMRFGRAGGADAEPARLGQMARQSFAVSDVAEVIAGQDGQKPQISVNVLGLIGPEGPMPLHLTRWILARQSSRWFGGTGSEATADTSFLDFLNMLQHRMLALYWRAWADARADIQIAHGEGGRVVAMMRAMTGIGLPGTRGRDSRLDSAKLRHATSLAQETRSPERLTAFLQSVLGVPVSLSEFVGVWIDIPDHLQTRVGTRYTRLGTGAVIGARQFDRQSRAEIRLGPLTRAEFDYFADDPQARARLCHALVFAQGHDVEFDLRLILAAGEVPRARLGSCRIGRTTWIDPRPGRDGDELCFHGIIRGTADAGTGRDAA